MTGKGDAEMKLSFQTCDQTQSRRDATLSESGSEVKFFRASLYINMLGS